MGPEPGLSGTEQTWDSVRPGFLCHHLDILQHQRGPQWSMSSLCTSCWVSSAAPEDCDQPHSHWVFLSVWVVGFPFCAAVLWSQPGHPALCHGAPAGLYLREVALSQPALPICPLLRIDTSPFPPSLSSGYSDFPSTGPTAINVAS